MPLARVRGAGGAPARPGRGRGGEDDERRGAGEGLRRVMQRAREEGRGERGEQAEGGEADGRAERGAEVLGPCGRGTDTLWGDRPGGVGASRVSGVAATRAMAISRPRGRRGTGPSAGCDPLGEDAGDQRAGADPADVGRDADDLGAAGAGLRTGAAWSSAIQAVAVAVTAPTARPLTAGASSPGRSRQTRNDTAVSAVSARAGSRTRGGRRRRRDGRRGRARS